MDFRVVWTRSALADLREIVRYIAKDDRDVARRFGERMIGKVESMAAFPRIGRMIPEFREDSVRELIITPYRIIDELDDEDGTLSVLRIWHGARGEPELR